MSPVVRASPPAPVSGGDGPVHWTAALVPTRCTVADVFRSLDRSGMQIALVVGDGGELIGTLTDGDVRRGLLRGLGMDSPIGEIVHRTPIVVPPELGREAVMQVMRANRRHQLPVVDENGLVVGLHLWDELVQPAQRPNTLLVMAGGKGLRLRPHTESCPKPMLPIGGKPMLEHIIERAKDQGFSHFVIAVHYLGHMIEEHFGDGGSRQVRIDYVREDRPLGTAGAISLLEPRPAAPIVVTNGDVLTDIHYGELLDFHVRHGAAATMAVRLHEWQHPFGVVRTSGVDIVGIEEKPVARSHINAGIYVLEPAALELLGAGERCDMPTLFARLQERQRRTIAYPMHEPWLDVGHADDLERARTDHPNPPVDPPTP
ncbi:MAG: nucleotidyltransferase family protein [Burkholderiales bacterium]|nr:nucleotidyltransferase family protein [Burkholderiales bacterium]